jgi:tRNA pseudouridine synthase 10
VRVFLESRYRKLVRGLPQTIFWCPECKGHGRRRAGCARCAGSGRLSADSVQELIARAVLPAFRARAGKFHGAGREDIDVKMLGRGRPFVFEVVGPRNLGVDLGALLERIHDAHGERIRLDPFVAVPRARVAYWKEAQFDKVYRARVRAAAAPAAALREALVGRTLTIRQRTPQRVVHRRADLEREREVIVQRIEPAGERALEVEVRCAHGTYVKEWVSGDEGRTEPSLAGLLGTACECEDLDVLDVLDPAPAQA